MIDQNENGLFILLLRGCTILDFKFWILKVLPVSYFRDPGIARTKPSGIALLSWAGYRVHNLNRNSHRVGGSRNSWLYFKKAWGSEPL